MRALILLLLLPALVALAPAQQAETTNQNVTAQTSQSLQTGSALPVGSGPADSQQSVLLRQAKTLTISSNTVFLPVATMTRALLRQKQWSGLGLVLVENAGAADLHLKIDRVVFTHVHTFVLVDTRTTIILGSGRQIALDGNFAAGGLAKEVVTVLTKARLPPVPENSQSRVTHERLNATP